MADTRPGGQGLFSDSVQALRGLKSRFEALERDAGELTVCSLYRQTPPNSEPSKPRVATLTDRGVRVFSLPGQNTKYVIPEPPDVRASRLCEGWGGSAFDLVCVTPGPGTHLASWEAPTGQAGLLPCQRRFTALGKSDDVRRLLSIANDAACLIANVIEASKLKGVRESLWPDIPVDVELTHHAGYWVDLVFEVGRWRLRSVPFRCELDPPDKVCGSFNGLPGKGSDRPLIDAVNRKIDEKRDVLARWNIDPTAKDFWTNLDQPPLMQMTLEGFAAKSAAVVDLLIQWGETGVNPFESRLNAGQREQDGNELNFEFPLKTPNKDFRLEALNHAVKRLVDFLRVQVLIRIGDPAIGWDQEQWTEQYWPNVRTEMELIWASLPEDSRQLYPSGYEAYFEDFEDFLGEVKNRYFESFPDVPRCPVDESLRERLGQHADVLKGCPEPNELRKSWEMKTTEAESPNKEMVPSPVKSEASGSPEGDVTIEGHIVRGRISRKQTGTLSQRGRKKAGELRTTNEMLLISALTKHHDYSNGSCGNTIAIGCNELARSVGLYQRNASVFFKKEFKGHQLYVKLCKDPPRLAAAMKTLNGEYRPHNFYDARTPSEVEQDNDIKENEE